MIPKNKLLLFLLLPSLLNSCSTEIRHEVSDNEKAINEKKEAIANNIENNLKQYKESKEMGKKIHISEKCIGCWKCVVSDSKHFKVNMRTFTPDIISQEDIYSESAKHAIDICPVGAISIS